MVDVLSVYYEDRRETQANKANIARLNKWWGGKMLSDVNGANCRAYTKWRGNNGGSRRDLEDLRAAIAGIALATERGWIELHESGTFVRLAKSISSSLRSRWRRASHPDVAKLLI